MVTLYIFEKTAWPRRQGPPVHCFWLCSDEEMTTPVTKFYHTAESGAHGEAHERQLRFIDSWARVANVRIGNRAAWSMAADEAA